MTENFTNFARLMHIEKNSKKSDFGTAPTPCGGAEHPDLRRCGVCPSYFCRRRELVSFRLVEHRHGAIDDLRGHMTGGTR